MITVKENYQIQGREGEASSGVSLFTYCTLDSDFAWRFQGRKDELRSMEPILALAWLHYECWRTFSSSEAAGVLE